MAKAPKKDGKGNVYADMIRSHMPLLDVMRTASRKAFMEAFCFKRVKEETEKVLFK